MVWCSHPSLRCFSICCNEFICCGRAIQFHSRELLCRHDVPCSSCVHCGPEVHPIVLDFNDFPRRRTGVVFHTQQRLVANFFVFTFDFLLVTSCHCSFSLSSNKNNACNSSSPSCTSSLMSPCVFFHSVQIPVRTALETSRRCVSTFPTAPATSGVTLATFLLPFSSHCPFPALFHLCRCRILLYTACTASSGVFPHPSSNVSSASAPAAMPISICELGKRCVCTHFGPKIDSSNIDSHLSLGIFRNAITK